MPEEFDNLDRLDRKLLHELDRNARLPLSVIAKRLRLGSDLVEYRVKRLTERGIIARFSAVLDFSAFGQNVYKSYVKFAPGKDARRRFLRAIDRHPLSYWLAESYGRWDVIFSLCCESPAQFQTAQDELLAPFAKHVNAVDVFTLVEVNRSTKHYLVGKGGEVLRLGQAARAAELDELERSILHLLSLDARMTHVELAERTGTTPAVTKHRISKLEQSGIIAGYRLQLNYNALGILLFKVLVQRSDYHPTQEAAMREYCREHPHITCYVRQVGMHNTELEIEARNYQQLHAIVDDFRERFESSVRSLELLLIREDHFHRIPPG